MAIVDREYCLRHPLEIIRLFGLQVFLSTLLSGRKSLLEHVVERYRSDRFPMPGYLGRAYRVSILIEQRMARVYDRMAKRFPTVPEAQALFRELRDEELEHCRLMTLCLYTVRLRPSLQFVPQISERPIRELLRRLRSIDRGIGHLALQEALQITAELESGEINIIFDRLLLQAECPESRLFADRLRQAQEHRESVPRRLAALRATLGLEP